MVPGEAAALTSVVRQNGVVHPQRLPTTGLILHSAWVCRRGCGLRVLCAILPKWFLPTRLETRTKESNIYASVLVEKPTRVMKVSDANSKDGSIDRPASTDGRFEYEHIC